MNVTVTEKAVRDFIREMLENPSLNRQVTGDVSSVTPVNVSDVVDPSAAATDPGNQNFKPRNRMELKTALSSMVDDISDDDASNFYKHMQDAVKKEEEMNKSKEDKSVEETVRRAVRKMLSEVGPYRDTGMSYSGPMTGSPSMKAGFEECEACEGEGILDDGTDCGVCMGKGAVPSKGRKNVMMTDVGGASFKEIAAKMGYAAESGAKQAVEKALQKARFVATMDPDELQIITLTAMNDYVEMLRKTGELTPADVQLMKDHPGITASLDGFREFLSKAIAKSQKSGQKMIDPVRD